MGEKNGRNIRFGRTRGGGGKRNKPLFPHLKCSENITSLRNGLGLPNGVIRAVIFPSGGREGGREGGRREVRRPPALKNLSGTSAASGFIFFVLLFGSLPLHLLSPPSSFPSPEALSGWAIGSIPANWGQRRIKLRSYGLIYTSISVDRRGNRILSPLILLGFLCTANIVWSVILKSSQLLSAALLCDFGYSLRQRELMVSDSLLVCPFSFSFFKPVQTILSLPSVCAPRPPSPPSTSSPFYNIPLSHAHTCRMYKGLFGAPCKPYALFAAEFFFFLILPLQPSERRAWAHCSGSGWG